jgi:hypothetical protein
MINAGKKSPSKLLARSQSDPGLSSTGIGVKMKALPRERDARYSTPIQVNSLFPTSCVRTDGIGFIPLSARNQG